MTTKFSSPSEFVWNKLVAADKTTYPEHYKDVVLLRFSKYDGVRVYNGYYSAENDEFRSQLEETCAGAGGGWDYSCSGDCCGSWFKLEDNDLWFYNEH